MLRNVLSVGGLTLLSRVTGFLRDVLMASILGAGPVADAFFVALRLPNHFRALFAEGAFAAAFVPLFSGRLMEEGEAAARRFAADVQAVLVASQLAILLAVMPGMPWFMRVFAPGFVDEPAKFDLAVTLTRITFPYLAFVAVQTLYAGVLNAKGRFASGAASPILFNLAMVAGLLLAPHFPTAGHALAWSVLLSGVLQYAYVAADAARHGLWLPPCRPRWNPGLKRFFALLGPAALGAGLTQINLFADTLIASLLPTGAVSYLYYADRLNQLPLGVIGIAMGTVLLPELTRRIKAGDTESAMGQQNRALELSLLTALPAAVAYILIGQDILSVLFQHGRFGAEDVAASAATLSAYALGLPAFIVLRSLVAGFYAREDTATPVRVALAASMVNVVLKVALMAPLAQVGLAVATSAAAWVNVGLLTWMLYRRNLFAIDDGFADKMPRIVLSAVTMGLVLAGAQAGLHPWMAHGQGVVVRLSALGLLCGIGAIAYGGAIIAFAAVDREMLRQLLARRRRRV